MSTDRYQHITDEELLRLFYTDSNNEWLGILLKRYTMLLFGVCMKYLKNEDLAKDAVQQVYLKTLSELHKYRVTYFKSWIYMVAKNYCLMQLRNYNKHESEINERVLSAPDETESKDIFLQKDLTLTLLETALEELNTEQKQCVTLFYLDKKSYQDISDFTGYTLLEVKSYIQNGKRNLKNRLLSLTNNE